MTTRLRPRSRFAIVDAGDVHAVQLALAASLEGSGRPLLPVAAPDRDRVLAIVDGLADAEVDSAGPALVMPTSGSTGTPKVVLLGPGALTSSAHATHRRLGGDGQWLLSLPTSGIAGLQVITRSILGGTTPTVVAPSAPAAELAEAAGRMTGRRYAALVPTQLHRLLADPVGADVLAAFDAVLIGGAAAPPALLEQARERGVRIVVTYGMTETSGGCVYDGRPLDGVAVAVDSTALVRIGGPTVFSGYLGRPADADGLLSNGWFTTADRGRIDDAGLLHILGRTDDVVVSGGVNVALPEVAARLMLHPDVTDAVAVGVPDDEWGTAVVAFVVPAPARGGEPATPGGDPLRSWVAAGLGRAHAPRRIVAIAAIPMLGNGKPDRQKLYRSAQEMLSAAKDEPE